MLSSVALRGTRASITAFSARRTTSRTVSWTVRGISAGLGAEQAVAAASTSASPGILQRMRCQQSNRTPPGSELVYAGITELRQFPGQREAITQTPQVSDRRL